MAITEQTANPLSQFLYALKAPETKRQWPNRLRVVFDFLGFPGNPDEQAKQFMTLCREGGMALVQDRIIQFISYEVQRAQRGEISLSTIPNYLKAIKLFCEMNDVQVSWKKISRGVPRGRQAANDRAPTREEILKLIQYPDRRIKPIVYMMASSGIRLGAWEYLQWKHVNAVCDEKGNLIAAKLIVYAGELDEYYTFVTPEAYNALKEWMDFRSSYGEKITGASWVMRDIWQTTNVNYGAKVGLATAPKKLKSSGIKRLLERALWEQGIRQSLPDGVRRHEWKSAHGFRKFYKTHAEQVMRPINVEITLGHNIGVSASYYKPRESEVLEDYLKAVESLTISNDKTMLTKQVADLKQKSKDSEYIIRGKLQEKDDQILNLTEQFSSMQSMMGNLLSCLSKTTDQQQLNTVSQMMFSSGLLKEMRRKAKK
ncbi:MAG: hypothetical protein GEU26_11730 [Nitrososphaeraceae archaeon]|nr:hypothetical protein [Nitrososphaeraceae archaeon]